MSTHAIAHRAHGRRRLPAAALLQLEWLGIGAVVGFGVPFLFADTLDLPRDLFYGIYAASAVSLFVLWARATGRPLGPMLRRNWVLCVTLGLAVAGLVAAMVVLVEDASARPGGLELVGAVLWRGVVYGAADGLLLSAFPILAVFAAFAGSPLLARWRGKIAVGAVALVASMAMTAVYHAGYSDFRSSKLRSPVAGDVVWSVPTLVTLNPIGAPIAHAGMHVSAVLHSYETDLFLPPHE